MAAHACTAKAACRDSQDQCKHRVYGLRVVKY